MVSEEISNAIMNMSNMHGCIREVHRMNLNKAKAEQLWQEYVEDDD